MHLIFQLRICGRLTLQVCVIIRATTSLLYLIIIYCIAIDLSLHIIRDVRQVGKCARGSGLWAIVINDAVNCPSDFAGKIGRNLPAYQA